MKWRKRTHGSPRQLGKPFPVYEKKKLPKRLSIPAAAGRITGITQVTYFAPTLERDGFISFSFGGELLKAAIKLVDKEKSIGQWDISKPIVYLDKKVPMSWQKYLSIHELLESHLQKKYNIPWNPYGHLIANELEHRVFRQSHPESEWRKYDKTVKFFSEMNATGGKIGKSGQLHRAFAMLRQAML